eukprot:6859422-Prymnesium_polylepis.1
MSGNDRGFVVTLGNGRAKVGPETQPRIPQKQKRGWLSSVPRAVWACLILVAIVPSIAIPIVTNMSNDDDGTPEGKAQVPAVRFKAQISGTVEEFNSQRQFAYKYNLAAQLEGVEVGDITLAVSAASVVVEATIKTSTTSRRDSVIEAISKMSRSDLTSALGVQVESSEVPEATEMLVDASPPPPRSPSSPPLKFPPPHSPHAHPPSHPPPHHPHPHPPSPAQPT